MEKLFSRGWIPVRRSDEDSGSQDGLLNGRDDHDGAQDQPRRKPRRCTPALIFTSINIAVCLITLTSLAFMNRRRYLFPQDSMSLSLLLSTIPRSAELTLIRL